MSGVPTADCSAICFLLRCYPLDLLFLHNDEILILPSTLLSRVPVVRALASQINQTLARLLIWLWAKVLMYRRRKTFLSNNLFVKKWIYLFNSAGFFEKEVI